MSDFLGEEMKVSSIIQKDTEDLESMSKEDLIALVRKFRAISFLQTNNNDPPKMETVKDLPPKMETVKDLPPKMEREPPRVTPREPFQETRGESNYELTPVPKGKPSPKNTSLSDTSLPPKKTSAPPPPTKATIVQQPSSPITNPNAVKVLPSSKSTAPPTTGLYNVPITIGSRTTSTPSVNNVQPGTPLVNGGNLPPAKPSTIGKKGVPPPKLATEPELPPAKETLSALPLYANMQNTENMESMGWYFGKIDRKQAEEILQKGGVGHYIARESSQKGSYAISYWHKELGINHTLIIPSGDGGYRFQDENEVCPSVMTLVRNCPKFMNMMPILQDQVDTPDPSYGVLRKYT